MLKALKIQLSLEFGKSILADQLKINSHHWILCCFHAQVIPKLCVYNLVRALYLSSLLTPKALRGPIPLNTQPKSVSLTRNQIHKSKPNRHLCQSTHQGQLPGPYKELSTIFLLKIVILPIVLNYFIVTLYFYGKVVNFMVTYFFLLLITKRP